MKILSIGNSFSEDAHKWLHELSINSDCVIDTINLMIGGCSLETHWKNINNDDPTYAMQGNGLDFIKQTTLKDALKCDKYDIITLQQVSGLSGKYETYFPYITELLEFVNQYQPQADIYLHRTWSYEIDSSHSSFIAYNCDQFTMFDSICNTYDNLSQTLGIPIIPVGDVIQYLRQNFDEFDYKKGGLSLCRDGFHLSLDYGRFTAAAVWYKTLTGNQVNIKGIVEKYPNFDVILLNKIISFINNI